MSNSNQKQCGDCEYWNERLFKQRKTLSGRTLRVCEMNKQVCNEYNYCNVNKFVPKGAFNEKVIISI
jgi:hypothetical protein